MKKVFISYKHDDDRYVNDVRSIRSNSNHPLSFNDRSLEEAILNEYGDINRRSPADAASLPVQDKIQQRLQDSDKLVVLIGDNTHSSLWVQWEMDTFRKFRGERNILMMRLPYSNGGVPSGYKSYDIRDWDLRYLSDWINT